MPAVVHELLGEAAKDHPLPDREIVRRVVAGEKALYEVLMRRHNQKLYRAVRSILKDEDEVEGVMQQAYVSAYFHLDQFRGAARFSTWLIRIAVHEAFARIREHGRFVETDTQDLIMSFPSKDRNPEEHASDRELGGLLQEAIDRLPASYRGVPVPRPAVRPSRRGSVRGDRVALHQRRLPFETGGGEVQARQPEPRAEDPGEGQELARHRRAQATITTASREASTRAAKRGGDGTGWHDARIWQTANAKTSKQRDSWDSKARDLQEAQGLVPHARRVACRFIDLLLGGGPEPRNRPERWSASTEASEMSPTLRSDSSIFLASDKFRLSGGAAFQNLPSQRPNVTEMEQSITTLAAPCTMTAGPS